MEINRYQLGKIYKITSEHTDKIYVGSTCKKLLCQRLAAHSSRFNQWKKGKADYTSSFELCKLGSVQITLLEAYPCNTKDELLSKERYWIEQYKDNIVNKYIPIKTIDEKKETRKKYLEANKVNIKERTKKYYEENKEKAKKYYEENKQIIICECGSNIQLVCKSKHELSKKHLYFLSKLN
jgi:hypothetical protein